MKARIAHALIETNPGKIVRLEILQVAYRAYVQMCIDQMVEAKRHHITPKEYQTFFAHSEVLTSQLQKCARMQAVHIVSTWVKSLVPRMMQVIYSKKYESDFRIQVKVAAKCGITKPKKVGRVNVSTEAIAVWWGMVWNVDVAGTTPVVADDLPMWLSEMCIRFGSSTDSKHLGWWVRVSSLEYRKLIEIPLARTPYLTNPEKMTKSVLVGKRRGRWTFQFTENVPETVFPETSKKVGVDVGLNALAATSDGRLEDQRTKPKFDRLYRKVKQVRANRQRQNLPRDSARVSRMEQRLSGMIKTATGTAARRLVAAYPGTTFVIENLDLRGCRGSKRFAYQALRRSLIGQAPTIKVNPAFTSQTCPSCGYVNRQNRSGTSFRCRCCGRVSHADVVGGLNLLGRSEDKQIAAVDYYKGVGAILRERYRQRRDSSVRRKPARSPLRQRLTTIPDGIASNLGGSDHD